MAVDAISPAALGLWTLEEAAAHHGCDPRTVRRWVTLGHLPALVVGEGQRVQYLVRRKDAERFAPPTAGRPRKDAAEKS